MLGYRGVVANVDPQFASSPEWYEILNGAGQADQLPCYFVLVDGADYATYVAEEQLERDDSGKPVQHPHLQGFFDGFRHGNYTCSRRLN